VALCLSCTPATFISGTGGDSAAGAQAAAASAAAIGQVVGGQPGVCYVICGAGGGTGGGASPLVLRAARAAGHLAVAVVTLPFSFEGPRRVRQSRATVAALQEAADLVFGEEEFTAMADGGPPSLWHQ
jgi:cell division protein FtsZ